MKKTRFLLLLPFVSSLFSCKNATLDLLKPMVAPDDIDKLSGITAITFQSVYLGKAYEEIISQVKLSYAEITHVSMERSIFDKTGQASISVNEFIVGDFNCGDTQYGTLAWSHNLTTRYASAYSIASNSYLHSEYALGDKGKLVYQKSFSMDDVLIHYGHTEVNESVYHLQDGLVSYFVDSSIGTPGEINPVDVVLGETKTKKLCLVYYTERSEKVDCYTAKGERTVGTKREYTHCLMDLNSISLPRINNISFSHAIETDIDENGTKQETFSPLEKTTSTSKFEYNKKTENNESRKALIEDFPKTTRTLAGIGIRDSENYTAMALERSDEDPNIYTASMNLEADKELNVAYSVEAYDYDKENETVEDKSVFKEILPLSDSVIKDLSDAKRVHIHDGALVADEDVEAVFTFRTIEDFPYLNVLSIEVN